MVTERDKTGSHSIGAPRVPLFFELSLPKSVVCHRPDEFWLSVVTSCSWANQLPESLSLSTPLDQLTIPIPAPILETVIPVLLPDSFRLPGDLPGLNSSSASCRPRHFTPTTPANNGSSAHFCAFFVKPESSYLFSISYKDRYPNSDSRYGKCLTRKMAIWRRNRNSPDRRGCFLPLMLEHV